MLPGLACPSMPNGWETLTERSSLWTVIGSIGVAPILKLGRIEVVAVPVVALPQVITPAVEVALTYAKEEEFVPHKYVL